MDSRYLSRLAEAYQRGHKVMYSDNDDAPEVKLHYFKIKEDLPRVQAVMSFIRAIVPAGRCNNLLDIGSGRGAFLFPLLRDFPSLEIESIDILPHRVEFLECISRGGVYNLKAKLGDICTADYPEASFDVVSLLEVLEHIPDAEKALMNAVRIARNYVIVSVPSKPDDNPEHIHLFSADQMSEMLLKAGCRKVKTMGVTGHNIFIATK